MKVISQSFFVIVLVAVILTTINYLGVKFPKRWDLTAEKEFTLSESTSRILDRLENRLTIKLYYSKNLPSILLPVKERVADIINEYKAITKQSVIVETIEPDLNEEVEKETLAMGIMPLELNVVEKDKQQVVKAFMGMALYYQDKKQVIPVVTDVENLEYLMDLNILKLTQKNLPKIGVYVGMRENFQLVNQVFEQLGEPVVIEQDTKDIDAMELSAMVVINPLDITKDFAAKLDELNESGVPLLVFAGNVNVDEGMRPEMINTGLDDWFESKGVLLNQKLLVDIKQNVQAGFQNGMMQVYMPYPFWVRALNVDFSADNIITAGLEDVLFPWSNVLNFSEDKKVTEKWDREVLVQSSKSSFLQEEEEPSVDPQYVSNLQSFPEFKIHPLSVVLKPRQLDGEQVADEDGSQSAPIFITANHHMLQDMFLQRSQANVVYLANMVEMATWGDYLIGIRSRGKTSRPIKELLPSERSNIKWGVTLGTPVVAVLIGLGVVFLLKRKRDAYVASLKFG